jgi:hypothetical protein
MDPHDPVNARQVVIEYARLLERDLTENRHPARADSLPFAKPIIKTAIRTCVTRMSSSGQLTAELREYFETAYTSLADYLDEELVNLMIEYRRSGETLTAEPLAHDRTTTAAGRTLSETASLAGEIARATTIEAEELRKEFWELMHQQK